MELLNMMASEIFKTATSFFTCRYHSVDLQPLYACIVVRRSLKSMERPLFDSVDDVEQSISSTEKL